MKNTTCNIEFQGQSNRQAALIHSYDEQCYFKMKIYADNSKCPVGATGIHKGAVNRYREAERGDGKSFSCPEGGGTQRFEVVLI